MRTPAHYIQAAGVLNLPNTFPWEGAGMHFGEHQGTKLHDALGKLNACANTTVLAVVEEWLIFRLGAAVDTARLLDHVDSVLAWEIDWRYRDESHLDDLLRNDTPINQALMDAVWCVRRGTGDRLWEYPAVHVKDSSALIHIVKQTLPAKQKKTFQSWLDAVLPRAAKVAPKPKKKRPNFLDFGDDDEGFREALRPFFGHALPREALDPEFKYKPEQREELLAAFLKGLDWKKNPFLRSPEKMKELGFEGTPYKL